MEFCMEKKTWFFFQGDIVYVNYGRVEDYLYLEANTSLNISGKIVLARYGEIFRGDKVRPSFFTHWQISQAITDIIMLEVPQKVLSVSLQCKLVYLNNGLELQAVLPATTLSTCI